MTEAIDHFVDATLLFKAGEDLAFHGVSGSVTTSRTHAFMDVKINAEMLVADVSSELVYLIRGNQGSLHIISDNYEGTFDSVVVSDSELLVCPGRLCITFRYFVNETGEPSRSLNR